ncbi:MAG: tetratricopeptide repeat protein [Limisphaerales bacterium]
MFRPRSIGLLLAFVTLLIYLPATSNQFLNYDDQEYITSNRVVQDGLTWAGVKWAFIGAHASNWHPLTWLSHMTDCNLFRLNPGGPHLVNILFHAVNATLLFHLLLRLTQKKWPALFVAAVFAWHPLHVESVAWVAERKDVLSTFFALLTLLSYVQYVQEKRRPSFWFAVFFFILALLSKPMAVTLPLVMLLLDYWPLKRIENDQSQIAATANRQKSMFKFQFSSMLEKWPFFLLAAASCVITFLAQRDTAVSSLARVPLDLRLENAVTAYAGYLWKMVWPMNLAIFYPLHAHIAWQSITGSAIVLAGISVIAWREREASPWLIVGWSWFLVTLVPVIGLIQVGAQAMADRYTYFPLIGIFIAIAFSVEALTGHFIYLKRWFGTAAILILSGCIFFTERQLSYWHDSESLFTHALTIEESDVAHANLGITLQEQNRPADALAHYLKAWHLNPGSDLIYGNIATALEDQGKLELAAVNYQEAIKRRPQSQFMREKYGIVLTKLGQFDKAINQFSVAAQLDATSADPHFLMGKSFLQQGREEEAMTHLRQALHLDPNNLEMLLLTANLLATDMNPEIRNGREAYVLAERLVKLTGGQQPAALDTLAMADAENGRFYEAVQNQQEAIKLIKVTGQKEDILAMQNRLQLYQKQQPWRASFKKTTIPEKSNLK